MNVLEICKSGTFWYYNSLAPYWMKVIIQIQISSFKYAKLGEKVLVFIIKFIHLSFSRQTKILVCLKSGVLETKTVTVLTEIKKSPNVTPRNMLSVEYQVSNESNVIISICQRFNE